MQILKFPNRYLLKLFITDVGYGNTVRRAVLDLELFLKIQIPYLL